MSSTSVRRVALLIETSRQFGREMLRGVIRYQQEHAPWEVAFEPRGFQELKPDWLRRWRGDGIIARIHSREIAQAVRRKKVPLVDLRGIYPFPNVPALAIDNRAIVRKAVEHLRQIGLTRFAYVGVREGQDPWLDDRSREFCRTLDESGFPYHLYDSPHGIVDNQLADERTEIARWLKTLPNPIGIVAYNDHRGRQVIDACRRSGTIVPDEAAVIGVDNDEFLCDLSKPTLSSINLSAQEAGFEAARLLDRMMNGSKPDRERVLLRSKSLIVRQSTDYLAIDNDAVRTAIRYLREHACDRIGVEDVLQRVDVSRRTLEQRFLKSVGRTLNAEIIRIRIERARRLLAETRLSAEEIATKIGIATAGHFSQLFKRETGRTPREYRSDFLS